MASPPPLPPNKTTPKGEQSRNPKHELVPLVATLETTAGESAQGTAMLVSGSDDHSLKIWDPQAQTCVATLFGHTEPVNCVAVLKDLREDPKRVVPMGKDIVISGSSDNKGSQNSTQKRMKIEQNATQG